MSNLENVAKLHHALTSVLGYEPQNDYYKMPLVKTLMKALRDDQFISGAEMQEILSTEDGIFTAPKSLGTFVDDKEKLILAGLHAALQTGFFRADETAKTTLKNYVNNTLWKLPTRKAYINERQQQGHKVGAIIGAPIVATVGGIFANVPGFVVGLVVGGAVGALIGEQVGRLYGKLDD